MSPDVDVGTAVQSNEPPPSDTSPFDTVYVHVTPSTVSVSANATMFANAANTAHRPISPMLFMIRPSFPLLIAIRFSAGNETPTPMHRSSASDEPVEIHRRRRSCTDGSVLFDASLRVKFPRLYSDASQTWQSASAIQGHQSPHPGYVPRIIPQSPCKSQGLHRRKTGHRHYAEIIEY